MIGDIDSRAMLRFFFWRLAVWGSSGINFEIRRKEIRVRVYPRLIIFLFDAVEYRKNVFGQIPLGANIFSCKKIYSNRPFDAKKWTPKAGQFAKCIFC
jgi:hypothetical protein